MGEGLESASLCYSMGPSPPTSVGNTGTVLPLVILLEYEVGVPLGFDIWSPLGAEYLQ